MMAESERAQYNANTEILTVYNQQPPPYTPYSPPVNNNEPQILQQTVIIQPPLKSNPTAYNCLSCHTNIITRVEHVNTRKTHMLAGFICGFTVWCFLCCLAAVPYMANFCKKTLHYCPNCKKYLGSYSKM